jgi:hypothetical protein
VVGYLIASGADYLVVAGQSSAPVTRVCGMTGMNQGDAFYYTHTSLALLIKNFSHRFETLWKN